MELQTPWPDVRCPGRNAGALVVSVMVPPRANDSNDKNGGRVAPEEQLYCETCTPQVPSSPMIYYFACAIAHVSAPQNRTPTPTADAARHICRWVPVLH